MESSAVDIDLDAEDDFVFEDELSSNMGESSMTVLEDGPYPVPANGRGGGGRLGRDEDAVGRMPLLQKLLTLTLYRRRSRRGQQDRHSSGLNVQMEMNRHGRGGEGGGRLGGQNRNEHKLAAVASGKKGWWRFLFSVDIVH